jgi:hypothetical protein
MMRKISDLLGRRSADEPNAAAPAAMVEYRIRGEGFDKLETIHRIYDRIDFPRTMRPGSLCHVSGISDDELVFLSVWDSERNAMAAYDDMSALIDEVIGEASPTASVERSSSLAARFVIGDDLEEFSNTRASFDPHCIGYISDFPIESGVPYELTCEKMNFPAEFPPGMLMHVAGETEDGWRTFTVWREIVQSGAFFRDRLMPAAVEVVREHGVFPVIRPIEIKPHMFVLNSRLLD